MLLCYIKGILYRILKKSSGIYFFISQFLPNFSLSRFLYPNQLNKKRIVLDLRVKLSTGENINVEMQSTSQAHFLKRILFYWANLYCQDLEKGQNYDKINLAYSFVFTSFPVLDPQIKEGLKATALNMLRKNFELSVISEVTGLSEEEIAKLGK